MKYIISILAWITGVTALTLSCSLFLLIVPFVKTRGISNLGSLTMRIVLRAFFVRVRIEGLEKIDLKAAHLYMSNHVSFFDFFMLGGYLPVDTRGLEAAEHFKWPLWGSFLRKTETIPIDRSNPRASMKAIKYAATRLEDGISILILPEGTRSFDGKLLPFKKLPFKLAKLGGTDLVPVGLLGTFEIKRKKSWILKPGRVVMRFGDPVPAERIAEISMDELMEETRARIAGLVGEEIRNPTSG